MANDLREACAPLGVPNAEREQAQAGGISAEEALTLDAIATARLAVALAARELRGGDALRDRFEATLLDWISDKGPPGAEPHLLPCVPEPPEPDADLPADPDPDPDIPQPANGSIRSDRIFL